MEDRHHGIISILLTIKVMAEVHRSLLEQKEFGRTRDRLEHAEFVLKRVYLQADRGLKLANPESSPEKS